jgi:GcrA cell cycle regulator
MPRRVWTDETKAALIKHFTVDGLSFSQIAARMNVTRNAVAGIICRLGLNGQGRNPGLPARSAHARPRPPRRTEPRRTTIVVCDGCVWPIGDPGENGFRFCGAEVASRQTYCNEHSGRAYMRETPGDGAQAKRARTPRAPRALRLDEGKEKRPTHPDHWA